jgi:hypothetical protein
MCGRGATNTNAENNNVHAASMPYPTARQAIQACQEGDVAIRLAGMDLVVDHETAYELDAEGIEFAYLHFMDRADGERIVVTVPVNLPIVGFREHRRHSFHSKRFSLEGTVDPWLAI